MKKFEADSLEKAYEMATLEFGCSITELSIEVFQQPSNGFLGFGKKRAIICAVCKTDKVDNNNSLKSYKNKSVNIEDVSSRLENSNKESIEKDCKTALETKEFIALDTAESEFSKAFTKLSIASVAIFLKPSLKLANILESTPDISLIKSIIFLILVTTELTTSGATVDTNE